MKKTIRLASALVSLVAFNSFGQNTFPSSGNVGIGTTGPADLLHLAGGHIRLSGGYSLGIDSGDILYYDGKNIPHYSLGWYNDSQHEGGPMGYLSGYGGLKFFTQGAFRMGIRENGNVGIGTSNPLDKLDVSGGHIRLSGGYSLGIDSGDILYYDGKNIPHYSLGWYNDSQHEGGPMGYLSGYGGLKFFTQGAFRMGIRENGNVGIGTSNPNAKLEVNGAVIIGGVPKNGSGTNLTPGTDYMLAVKGKVYCQEVNVTPATAWADYVFKKDYKLLSLEEVEKHIKEKGHLKDVPSAEEVTKAGYNVGAMDATLLKKIEELTLHLIEQNKQLQDLRKVNEVLQKEVQSLKK